MRLSEIKGEQAFKAIGQIVGCLRELFTDEKVLKIVTEQQKGWMLEFFQTSLEERSETWLKMYLILNPETDVNDVSLGSVVRFAYDFKNDPELMSLFFSQSEQTVKNFSGSHTENIEETETT